MLLHQCLKKQIAADRFPLEQASDAFKALLSRQVIGKILLVPDSGAQSKL